MEASGDDLGCIRTAARVIHPLPGALRRQEMQKEALLPAEKPRLNTETGCDLMPRVDVRTLADPILIRLHLVSEKMMTDQEIGEVTDWQYIARVTANELTRRGLRPEDVRCFETLDADSQRSIVAAFRSEQEQQRRHRRN